MTITFYQRSGSDSIPVGSVSSVVSGNTAAVSFNNLQHSTLYTWFAVVCDGQDSSVTPDYTFTTTGEPSGPRGPFTIYHINDMHSRLTPHDLKLPSEYDTTGFELVGGASRLATKMLQLKAADTNSLILDAGDISEGNPLGDIRGNGGILDFMNLLDAKLKAQGGRGIDATVVGNHDFRCRSYLLNMKNAHFPIVSMNVCENGTRIPYFKAYTIVQVNGQKVGILGFTHHEEAPSTETDSIIDIVRCTWADSDPSTIDVKDYVDSLRNHYGCTAVILLAHYGHTGIVAPTSDAAIPLIVDSTGTKIPEAVITGHWHSMTDNVWQPKTLNNNSFIAEAASYMEFIGEVNVDSLGRFVSARKHAIRASEILPDPSVDSLIDVLIDEYNDSFPGRPLFDTLGYSAIDLTLDDDKWWSMNEYPWPGDNSAGNFICEAMKWKMLQAGKSCDLAMQSGGGIRRDIKAGPLTYLSVYEMYPWDEDSMAHVGMSGAQIRKFIEDEGCGVALSEGWQIWAQDGEIDSIKYNGVHVYETSSPTYNVAVSNYMYEHREGTEFGTLIESTSLSIREGAAGYTATFPTGSPYAGYGRRYYLDTDMAGIFDAVVTMIDDDDDSPIYENAFVRLLHASPSTVAQIGKYVPASLVNPDGSIDRNHQMSECMHYRGYLGFPKGLLKNGSIIRIKAEGGFYRYSPELIEEEGIVARDSVFEIRGFDTTLAQPEYMPCIDSFWNEHYENHYVQFYAKRTSANTVADRNGTIISTYQAGGYNSRILPGSNGDLLEICGTQTQYWEDRRFRVGKVSIASTNGFPPSSMVAAILPYEQTTTPLTLMATVSDDVTNVISFNAVADAYVVEGRPTYNYGSSTSMYLQKSGGTYLEEQAYMKFTAGGIPSGSTVRHATLKMYTWAHSGEGFDAALHFVPTDSWAENTITWNNKPSYDVFGVDTVSLSAEDVWYAWNVTAVVDSVLASGDSTLSFLLRALSGTSSYTFDSKEYGSGSLAPRLEITYSDSDAGTQVTGVEFFYRYSSDNSTYGAWTSAGVAGSSPFEAVFNYPHGFGYYEFYSIATDNDMNVETAPLYADASAKYTCCNGAPVVSNPVPASGTFNIPLNTQLSVTVTDPDSDVMTVKFYRRTGGPVLIDSVAGVVSGNSVHVPFTGLQQSTQYTWYAVAHDGSLQTQSPDYLFTTEIPPVSVPASSASLVALLSFLLAGFGGYMLLRKNTKH